MNSLTAPARNWSNGPQPRNFVQKVVPTVPTRGTCPLIENGDEVIITYPTGGAHGCAVKSDSKFAVIIPISHPRSPSSGKPTQLAPSFLFSPTLSFLVVCHIPLERRPPPPREATLDTFGRTVRNQINFHMELAEEEKRGGRHREEP